MHSESRPKNIGYAGGLNKERFQFGKDGGMPVGLVIDLVASPGADQQASRRQVRQLSLNGPLPQGNGPNDLPKIESLPVVAAKQG